MNRNNNYYNFNNNNNNINNNNVNQGSQQNFQNQQNRFNQNNQNYVNFNQPNNFMDNLPNNFNFYPLNQQQNNNYYNQIGYNNQYPQEESEIQSNLQETNNQNNNANMRTNAVQNYQNLQTNDVNIGLVSMNPDNGYNNSNQNNNNNNYYYNYNQNQNNISNNQSANDHNQQQLYHQFRQQPNQLQMNYYQQMPQHQNPEWKEEYDNIAYFQGLNVPIPTFVGDDQREKLRKILSEINKDMMQFLQNRQNKEQIITQIQEQFRRSNQISFNCINSNNQMQSNQSLSFNDEETDTHSTIDLSNYTDNEYNQKSSLYSYATSEEQMLDNNINNNNNKNNNNNLIQFIIGLNELNIIQKDFFIEKFKEELKNNIQTLKKNFLIDQSDYEQSTIDKIKKIKEINQFGLDLCKQEKNQIYFKNQKFQTVSFDFRKEKLLKTTLYCILQNFICKGSQAKSTKYLMKQLKHINQKNQMLEVDNIILRQIFLRFFDLVNSDEQNHKKITQEFLDNLFKYEFLSTVLLDHYKRLVRFLSQQELKENSHEILEQFIKTYFLYLQIIDSNSLKYQKKCKNSKFPYFLCFYTENDIKQQGKDKIQIVQDFQKLMALK
ncbi:hypothetical protein ABPG72_021867 [Tetrahymena utriculariae]